MINTQTTINNIYKKKARLVTNMKANIINKEQSSYKIRSAYSKKCNYKDIITNTIKKGVCFFKEIT